MKLTPFSLEIFTQSKRVPIPNSFLSWNIHLQLTNIHVINVNQYQTPSSHEAYTFQPTNIHVIKTCTNIKHFPIRKHRTSGNKYSCNQRVPISNSYLSWNVHLSANKYSRNQNVYQYQTHSYHETYTFQPTNIHVIKKCTNIKRFPIMQRTPFSLQIFT